METEPLKYLINVQTGLNRLLKDRPLGVSPAVTDQRPPSPPLIQHEAYQPHPQPRRASGSLSGTR